MPWAVSTQHLQASSAVRGQFRMQLAHELDEVDVESSQPVSQFDNVKPTLATLHLTDQSLVAP